MSLFKQIELDGYLYRSANGHPASQSSRAFVGLRVRRWVELRKDTKELTIYKNPTDTEYEGRELVAPIECAKSAVEEPADEPTCFVVHAPKATPQHLYAADAEERALWVRSILSLGASVYVPPHRMTAEEAAAEVAREVTQALRRARSGAGRLTLEPTPELSWQEKQIGGKDGEPKSYMPGAVVDRELTALVDSALANVGVYVFNAIKDPAMPRWMLGAIDRAHDEVWDDIETELRDIVLSSFDFGDKEAKLFKEMRLKHWSQQHPWFWPPGRCCPNPYNALRARVLWAILPADATTWMKLRSPFTVFMMLLSATPTLAINVWVFVFLFGMIDRRDEFQLVNFILKFKGFQFASGVFSSVQAALKLYQCVDHVGLCETAAPGQGAGFPFEIACEPLRLVVVWAAFALLWCGHARGGREEIVALETVRIDAADGDLDGTRDIDKLRAAESKGEAMEASHSIDDDEVHAANEEARKKFNVKTGYGGYLGYFMVVDLFAFSACCGFFGWQIYKNGYWVEDWMFFLSLYYLKASYALLSFPFLLFAVPVLDVVLTHAKPTGYDKMGILCPKLSAAQVAKKQQIERELRLRRLELDHRPGLSKLADRAGRWMRSTGKFATGRYKFALGARVRHSSRGNGVVTELMEDGRTRVIFDDGHEHRYQNSSMHKLKMIDVRANANLTRAATSFKWAVHTGVEGIKRTGSSIAGSVRGAGSVCGGGGSVCGDSSPTTRML